MADLPSSSPPRATPSNTALFSVTDLSDQLTASITANNPQVIPSLPSTNFAVPSENFTVLNQPKMTTILTFKGGVESNRTSIGKIIAFVIITAVIAAILLF
jgi:hypothetical protein